MRVIIGRRDSSTTLTEVPKLCSEACEVFHTLNLTNKWNIPQSHHADVLSPPVTTVALQTIPVINALSHVMRPKSRRPRRPVLRPSRKGMVVVVVAVVVVAMGGGSRR
jgi:hypothetical protein